MFDDAIETLSGGWGLGAALVVGSALLLARSGRPLAKTAVRGWFEGRDCVQGLGDRARSLTAEAKENIQDLFAEARAEAAKATP
jgi:hypothetical protein